MDSPLLRTRTATLFWYLTRRVAKVGYAVVGVLLLVGAVALFAPRSEVVSPPPSSFPNRTTTSTSLDESAPTTTTPAVAETTTVPPVITVPTTAPPPPVPETSPPTPAPPQTPPQTAPPQTPPQTAPPQTAPPQTDPPVQVTRARDNCPNGDYSGGAYDGSCGTPPQTAPPSNTLTYRKTVTCNAPVTMTVYGSGRGQVSTVVSGAASGSGGAQIRISGPAGTYNIAVTDTGGAPSMRMSAQGAVCG